MLYLNNKKQKQEISCKSSENYCNRIRYFDDKNTKKKHPNYKINITNSPQNSVNDHHKISHFYHKKSKICDDPNLKDPQIFSKNLEITATKPVNQAEACKSLARVCFTATNTDHLNAADSHQ